MEESDTKQLAAYRAMHRELETVYDETCTRLEQLRAAGKQKTVGYREALGWKVYYRNVLELYARYGLGERPPL